MTQFVTRLVLGAGSLLAWGPALAAQRSPNLAPLDSLIRAEMERSGTPGASVAVVANGQIVYAKGFGVANIESGTPVTTETLFRVGSVTKMFTGALLSQLAEQGQIDLQAPISRYVPELADKKVGTVTTHQLLTHTAGWMDNAVPYGRMGEGALGEVMREVGDTLFITEPGRVLSYSNPGYSMVGYVAERAGGKRYAALMEDLVLAPAGMTASTFKPLEAMTRQFSQGHQGQPGQPATVVRPFTENTAQWAAGFLMSTPTELARFAMMVMGNGSLEGRQALAAAAVGRMTMGHVPVPGQEATGGRYGYGLIVGHRGALGTLQHGGGINGFQANVVMVPERGFAVVILTNLAGSQLPGVVDLAVRLGLGELPARSAVPTGRPPTSAEVASLVGSFALGATPVEFLEREGRLLLRQGGAEIPVLMFGPNQVGFTPPGAQAPVLLVTVPGPDGRVAFLHQGLRAIPRTP
ncbi:MAG: serine hydrolase domain-containing protein [Gemmatimonadota bacterium]|nr:serine hydrolase domain-containing protein [Gemmatimonadota bacterium]